MIKLFLTKHYVFFSAQIDLMREEVWRRKCVKVMGCFTSMGWHFSFHFRTLKPISHLDALHFPAIRKYGENQFLRCFLSSLLLS